MQLNKGLNLDIHPSEVTTGEFRYASNISLDSSFRNPINEKGLRLIAGVTDITTLAGVIPYDKGIVVFANTNYIYNINTQVSPEVITKTVNIPQIEFLPEKPIRGTYTYNENKDLIIIFSSGVNGNFEDKIINITKCPTVFGSSDYYMLDINPNVQFPNITSKLTSGALLSGSYQICISYKIDKEYTNHSLLSLPVYIYGTEERGDGGRDGLSPNQLTSKGIKYTLNNLDTHYTKYRISVIYNDGTTFIVYDSPDILTSTSEYIIYNLVAFTKSSLDDKLINSIFYSNSESLTIMNNITYRANLKGHNYGNGFDDVAQYLANKVNLELKETVLGGSDFSNIKSKQFIKFQNDEAYALYLTLGDKKGNIIGSYPIDTLHTIGLYASNKRRLTTNDVTLTFSGNENRTVKVELENPAITNVIILLEGYALNNSRISIILTIDKGNLASNSYINSTVAPNINSFTESILSINYINIDNINKYYLIPKENTRVEGSDVIYTTNHIEVSLPDVSTLSLTTEEQSEINKIGFWCVHRALRTNTNSKIYSQGIITAQPKIRYDYTRIVSGEVLLDLPMALEYTNPQKIDKSEPSTNYYGYLNNYLDSQFKEKNDYQNQVRFYSFEDLFNKQDNFPTERLEIISKYDYLMKTPSTSGANNYINQTLYGSTEKVKSLNKNITKQELHQGNNISILNPLLEASRILTLDGTSLYILPDSNVDDRTKIYRVNSINKVSNGYYKYIYNETLVLASGLNKISDLKIKAYGDTFYSEVLLNLKRLFDTNISEFTESNLIVWGINNITEAYNPEFLKDKIYQFNLRVFIESKYNVHARYWEGDYPEWDQPISTSEQIGYNKVYNLQNTSNVTTIVDVNNNEERESNKGEYPSRIIISKTKSKESNTLNFRKYLALDYYDMPYNRNAIVALNATYKNLYIQQELALSIASIKDVISYEDGTTYVGSGQLFDRQPTEVIPTGYGFLGCENYFNTGITDLGLWVIDNVQSIIALITDEGINIISNGNNQNWFNNKLRGNNPFINEGCFITYDNSDKQLKRLMLTIHQENKTISYIPAIKNWFSFHSYVPRFGVYTRNDTYYFFDRFTSGGAVNRLFKYSNTLKSKFSDLSNINKSVLSIYFNEDKGLKKLFQSLYWQTQFILSGTDIYDKTFTKLFVHNDSQCTKEVTIGNNAEWFDSDNGVYKEDLWIFNGFEDYVKDNRKPFIDDSINIINSNFNYSKEWFDISKFMSIFAVVTFKFDNWYYSIDGKTKSLQPTVSNIEQPKLILNDVTMAYKKSIR